LSRVQAEARALLPVRAEEPNLTPDADDDVEPAEALGNFHLVAPGFYRSAQPNKDGYARLRQLGFKTILTLKEGAARERADAAPIKVESVPMSGLSAPSFEEVDRALEVVATAERPLLVHCQHGKDRTGFVVASYRVMVEGMDVDKAVEEAHSYGCCFVAFGDLGGFLRRYAEHARSRRGTPAVRP